MKKILKKIKNDHYIVVDDSEIKEGDWYVNNNVIFRSDDSFDEGNNPNQNSINKKITHSTQPLEWFGGEIIFLSEVKELIGEVDVDVEKKASEYAVDDFDDYAFCGYIKGYNQALEDNKEKKYTEKDIRKAIEMARDIKDDSAHDIFTAEDISGCAEVCTYGWRNRYKDEEIIQSLQPKTEWEVEFDENGKLKLI